MRICGCASVKSNRLHAGDSGSRRFITLAARPQDPGRRGGFATELHSDVPDRFRQVCGLALPKEGDGPRRELKIEERWPHKGYRVLKFERRRFDFGSRALMEASCSSRPASDRGWNPDGYVSDLCGMRGARRRSEIGSLLTFSLWIGERPAHRQSGIEAYEILRGSVLEEHGP